MVSVNQAQSLTFGAGFEAYPAVYIFGRLSASSDNYFYRSDDAGQSWIRINEHSEKEVWSSIRTIAGDRNIPGRLYAAASGQGVIFGGKANNMPDLGTTGDSVTGDPENTESVNTGDDVVDDSNTTESGSTGDNVGGDPDATESINPGDNVIDDSDTTESVNTGDNVISDTNMGSVIEENNRGGGSTSLLLLLFLFWIKTTLTRKRLKTNSDCNSFCVNTLHGFR